MFRMISPIAALVLFSVPVLAQPATIVVVAIEEDRAAIGCRDGILEGLPSVGYVDGDNVNVVFEAAGNDSAEATDLVERAVDAAPDIIVPVGSRMAKAIAAETDDIPIVFCAVGDPVAAGIAEDVMRPGGNATGVSDMAPVSAQLALIREVLPDVRRLGVIYDPNFETSARMIKRMEDFAPGAGFEIVTSPVGDASDVEAAMRNLVGQVDAVYLPQDETVLPAIETAVTVAEEERLPLFTGDAQSVEQGAIGSLSVDYNEMGVQTAALLGRVLDGEGTAEIPVTEAEGAYLVVNAGAAERMGLDLAPGFVARANEIIE